jgi:hypothetical protein
LAKISENCDHTIDPRCVYGKIAQNVAQAIFYQNEGITVEKIDQKLGLLPQIKKTSKVNNFPTGEKLPNTITLVATCVPPGASPIITMS